MFSQATGQSIFQNFDLRFPVSVFVSFCFIVILGLSDGIRSVIAAYS